jgi:hypothetical protein
MAYFKMRVRDVTHKTRDVIRLDAKMARFRKNRLVTVRHGQLTNRFTGKPYKHALMGGFVGKIVKIQPVYSKNDFFAQVRFKDMSKALKSTIGINKFWYMGSNLRSISKGYHMVLPRFTSDVR